MKNALLHRQAGLSFFKKGQSILEIVIYMVILGVIAVAGSIGYSIYLQDANGSACSQQLTQLDIADKAYCATYNVTTVAGFPSYTSPSTSFTAYLDGKTINASGGIQCPAGGTYTPPTQFENTATTTPSYPNCNLGVPGQFSGTRFHSLTLIPAAP